MCVSLIPCRMKKSCSELTGVKKKLKKNAKKQKKVTAFAKKNVYL